jgi:short-subunit dehydrogenase
VNLVINNAGVALHQTVLETPLEDYEWIVGINFWCVVYGTKAFLPDLIASGDGHLVNVSSLCGLIAVPENSGYGATKFAVRGFTESLRQEMLTAGHPVSVSCVHPGVVKTNIARAARVPGGDAARRAELAESVERIAFASPESAARTILRGIERDRPRILVGAGARALDLMQRVLGSGYQRVVARAAARASSAVSLGAPWGAGEIPTLLRLAWVGVAGAGRVGAGVVAAASSLRRSAAALGGERPGVRR